MAKQTKRKFMDKVMGCDNIPEEYKKYYVVLRSGRRVSDTNHTSYDDADYEKAYWDNILRRHPDGTTMSIVECDNPSFKTKVSVSDIQDISRVY